METYCLKCRKYTKNMKPQISSTSKGKTMMISKCAVCKSKKCKFIKKQEAKCLLSKLGIKTPLNKITVNRIVNKFLPVGDKFVPEMHLKQSGFIYSACGPFTKNKERIKKFNETGDTNYIYKNELDKACFKHDMAYDDFKD